MPKRPQARARKLGLGFSEVCSGKTAGLDYFSRIGSQGSLHSMFQRTNRQVSAECCGDFACSSAYYTTDSTSCTSLHYYFSISELFGVTWEQSSQYKGSAPQLCRNQASNLRCPFSSYGRIACTRISSIHEPQVTWCDDLEFQVHLEMKNGHG